MGWVRLRTKFLVAMLLTSAGLTAVTLLIVQRSVENQVRRELGERPGQLGLTRFATYKKNAKPPWPTRPNWCRPSYPKALMTSHDAPTIQDASTEMSRLSGGDLFALLDPSDRFVGFHTRATGRQSRASPAGCLDSQQSPERAFAVVVRWRTSLRGVSQTHLFRSALRQLSCWVRWLIGYEIDVASRPAGQQNRRQ